MPYTTLSWVFGLFTQRLCCSTFYLSGAIKGCKVKFSKKDLFTDWQPLLVYEALNRVWEEAMLGTRMLQNGDDQRRTLESSVIFS